MNNIASDMFDKIAAKLTQELEKAMREGAKWKSPWARSAAAGGPISIVGRPYRGGNAFWLSLLADEYPTQIFGTYKAWAKAGFQIQKGSKGIPIAFWQRKTITEEDETTGEEKSKSIMWCKVYKIFAAEQTDATPAQLAELRGAGPTLPEGAEIFDAAQSLLDAYMKAEGVQLGIGGNRACYSPMLDKIQMPQIEAFHDTAGYYGTFLHEAVHSTGHSSRLDRDFSGRFGSQAYAFEELVAEIGSAFLCCATGVTAEPREDHAHYLASWCEILREEKGKAILTATSKAQQAADMLLQYAEALETEMEEAA